MLVAKRVLKQIVSDVELLVGCCHLDWCGGGTGESIGIEAVSVLMCSHHAHRMTPASREVVATYDYVVVDYVIGRREC